MLHKSTYFFYESIKTVYLSNHQTFNFVVFLVRVFFLIKFFFVVFVFNCFHFIDVILSSEVSRLQHYCVCDKDKMGA